MQHITRNSNLQTQNSNRETFNSILEARSMRNAHDWNFRHIVSHTRTFYMQDWFAFTGNGSEFNFSRAGEVNFPNSGTPKAENNYGFCQVSVAISVPIF